MVSQPTEIHPKNKTTNKQKQRLYEVTLALFTVIAFSSAGTIYTIVGNGKTGFAGNGGPAVDAVLNNPAQISLSSTGELYIADSANNVVRVVSTNGYITNFAGNNIAGYTGDNGPATNASLNTPVGVFAAPNGNVYISDSWNNVVRVVSTNGIINTFAGNGTDGYYGDGGLATKAMLGDPIGIFVTSTGEVYIAEAENNVIRMVFTNNIIATIAGNGVWGYSGDGGLASSATLTFPSDVYVTSDGKIYITDTGNNVVRLISNGGIIATFAGTGATGYSGDNGPAIKATFNTPTGVTVSSNGNVYIADSSNNVIRIVYTNGTIATYAGNGAAGFSGDGGPSISASLNSPYFVSVSPTDELYISDNGNERIRRICNSSYTGFDCQIPFCHGINGSSISVCSGQGSCVGYNICNCTRGFTGLECSQKQESSIAFRNYVSLWMAIAFMVVLMKLSNF